MHGPAGVCLTAACPCPSFLPYFPLRRPTQTLKADLYVLFVSLVKKARLRSKSLHRNFDLNAGRPTSRELGIHDPGYRHHDVHSPHTVTPFFFELYP